MFIRKIQENQFVSTVGDELFPHINAASYAGGDFSLRTVLRALLGDRIDPDEEVLGVFMFQETPEPVPVKAGNSLTIVEVPVGGDLSGLPEKMPGFEPIPVLSKFLKEKVDIDSLFLLNEETRQTVCWVCGLNVRYLHLILSFLPRMLPWFFKQKPLYRDGKPEDAQAIELLQACAEQGASRFENAVAAMYSRYDFREATIRAKLRGFESKFHETELETIRSQIQSTRRRMEDYRQEIANLYRELDRESVMEAGLIQKIHDESEGGSEIMDMFLTYRNIHLVSVEGTAVTFVVDTLINNFNPDDFLLTIENKKSFWYRAESGRHYSRAWPDEKIEKFLRAIFEDEILKIKVCAAYRIDFGRGNFAGVAGFNFGPEFSDHMPNQHIQQYHCIGYGHETQLYEAMEKRDYVGAINVCVASAGNMSMQEAPTGEYHMKYLLGDDPGKCIVLPDGRNVTPLEAAQWLEEQESEGGNENE